MNTTSLPNTRAITQGCHHIGLTVADLAVSEQFFCETLGWSVVRRDEGYPAVFVSDGSIMITLWQARGEKRAFDFQQQQGLHHLALKVASEADLQAVHQRVQSHPGVRIEFAPELLRQGPAKHMMCYEPNGLRIEFIWPGL